MEARKQSIVLHVDDNETNRYMVSKLLRRAGYAVLETDSGLRALDIAKHKPNLIVLDVNLPDLNGYAVCKSLRSDPETSSIPILHLSATRVRTRDKTQGLEMGADAYLTQPVDEGEFLATVKALLRVREAEQKSKDLAREWQLTFDTIREGICLVDRQGKIARANLSMEKVVGQPRANLVGVSLKDLLQEKFQVVLEDRDVQEMKLDSLCYEVKRTSAIKGTEQDVGTVWTFSDVTHEKDIERERKKYIVELERSNEELDHFAHVASHDLKEPLRMVALYMDLLSRHLDSDESEEVQECLTFARDGSRRMMALIDDLLAYSSVNNKNTNFEDTDLNLVLKQTIEGLKPIIMDSQAEILVESLPQLKVDPVRISQLFQNLVANAIKFRGKEMPRVHIGHRDVGTHYEFWVKDNGIGVPEKDLLRIFKIFTRLHSRESIPGSGIGLATCRKIVEQHSGKIWAESKVGAGSIFYFTLAK